MRGVYTAGRVYGQTEYTGTTIFKKLKITTANGRHGTPYRLLFTLYEVSPEGGGGIRLQPNRGRSMYVISPPRTSSLSQTHNPTNEGTKMVALYLQPKLVWSDTLEDAPQGTLRGDNPLLVRWHNDDDTATRWEGF